MAGHERHPNGQSLPRNSLRSGIPVRLDLAPVGFGPGIVGGANGAGTALDVPRAPRRCSVRSQHGRPCSVEFPNTSHQRRFRPVGEPGLDLRGRCMARRCSLPSGRDGRRGRELPANPVFFVFRRRRVSPWQPGTRRTENEILRDRLSTRGITQDQCSAWLNAGFPHTFHSNPCDSYPLLHLRVVGRCSTRPACIRTESRNRPASKHLIPCGLLIE